MIDDNTHIRVKLNVLNVKCCFNPSNICIQKKCIFYTDILYTYPKFVLSFLDEKIIRKYFRE